MTAAEARRSTPSGARTLAVLAVDIGAPIAVYYLLHSLGVSNLMALGAGAVLPALSAGYTLAVRRRANGIAIFVLVTILVSIVVSVIAKDPRFLLAKDGMITGLWGLWFLGSVRARRPAAFVFTRPLMEGRKMFAATDWDALWDAEPAFRRIWRVSSVMWGVGMLADAAARVVMSYTLPVSVVPGLGGALWPVTFVVLQIVTNVYYQLAGLNQLLGARWLNGRDRHRVLLRVEDPAGPEGEVQARRREDVDQVVSTGRE
jgi:hypothetical protein